MREYFIVFTILVLTMFSFQSSMGQSNQVEADAKRILERMSGTKVSMDHPLLQEMIPLVRNGNLMGAAQVAARHPNFLNVTVKLMALQMSTREETLRLPLNDFAAMFMGVTRDETDSRELLMGNFTYKGGVVNDAARGISSVANTDATTGADVSVDYTINGKVINVRNNMRRDVVDSNGTTSNHYIDLEKAGMDAGAVLVRVNSQPMRHKTDAAAVVDNTDPAGVLTSKAFMKAHAVAGTNRRLVEYTLREFTCLPIEKWSDTKVADLRIGRDVERFPGGDHSKFLTTCKGCHNVQDGFRGAFAQWDSDGSRVMHGGTANADDGDYENQTVNGVTRKVGRKYNKNGIVFPGGYITRDTSFINNAQGVTNTSLFGWRGQRINGGTGAGQFGELVANSQRFSQCMVKRVFEATCRKAIEIESSWSYINSMSSKFESSNYNLKQLFENIVISKECI